MTLIILANNQGLFGPTILAESHDQGQCAKEREHHAQVLWMAQARIEREAMAPWDCSTQPGHHSETKTSPAATLPPLGMFQFGTWAKDHRKNPSMWQADLKP